MASERPTALVIGAGAVGGAIAAALARGGAEVALHGRSGALDAIPAVETGAARWPERAVGAADAPDAVFVAVKAPDIAAALEGAVRIAGAAPIVVCANGVPVWLGARHPVFAGRSVAALLDPEGRIAACVRDRDLRGTVVRFGARSGDGVVFLSEGPLLRVEAGMGGAALDALAAGGIAVAEEVGFAGIVWDKLMGNAVFNPLTAITGLALGPATERLRRVALAAMEEARAVGEAAGLPVTEDLAARIAAARRNPGHRSSMLQDVEAGRPLETDAIVRAVAAMGRDLGLACPLLEALADLADARTAAPRPDAAVS